ncbi:hypothetical protein FB567DRAFT_93016 [Paraphoma chrysanthemicola]|uniref:Uncharacterized protein n=1 Tax=Paraphoma chrysanthemicola TaxID=798071 RepID=A0A8K0R306_9PLEO|nr:hypothetical protein FB567DRAFT_93016 [Paraphoma chrysanthemicola]
MKNSICTLIFPQLLARTANAQAIGQMVACPEQLGGQVQACQAEGCGNNNATGTGRCSETAVDGSNCLCDSAITSPPQRLITTVTATATESGQVPTGTYALATLPAYSNLRDTVTTSVTFQPIASGSPESVVPVVVFAGGVAWYLAGLTGGEAAIFNPPNEVAGHPNDDACTGERLACKDCGGQLGFCTTIKAGCACEQGERLCPTQKPSCEAPDCVEDKGKCTLGTLKDCVCEASCPTQDKKPDCRHETCKGNEQNKCTEEHKGCECEVVCTEDLPFCSTCGGEEYDKSNCKGGTPCCKESQGDSGCGCYLEENPLLLGLQHQINSEEVGKWYQKLQPQEQPICQERNDAVSELLAPQHERDGSPSVESAAKEFCSRIDGKIVTEGGQPEYQFNTHLFSTFWLSASFRNNAPSPQKCSKEAKVTKDDCMNGFNTAITRCEPYQKVTHGAAIPRGCVFYNVTLNGESNEHSPPWAPPQSKPTCGSNITDITNVFFKNLYPSFCKQITQDDKPLRKTLTNADLQPISRKRTPPPSSKSFQNYWFEFSYGGGSEGCSKSCEQAFAEMNSNCGREGTTMKDRGEFDPGCGKYSYKIGIPHPEFPPVCKPSDGPDENYAGTICVPYCRKTQTGHPKAGFQAAIHEFCYNGGDMAGRNGRGGSAIKRYLFDTTTINPDTKLPQLCDSHSKDVKCHAGGNWGEDVGFEITVLPAWQGPECRPGKYEHPLPKGETCVRYLDKIIDGCLKGNKDDIGGSWVENTVDGCWQWWIYGQAIPEKPKGRNPKRNELEG